MMQQINENALIARMAALLPHRPNQVNGLQESDAEIIRLPGDGSGMLALTTDSIVEEIETGLYTDPYLIGWMTVMANLSDLAAVGAEPAGLLVSETLPRGASDTDVTELQSGIRDACLCAGTPVLGGDTSFSDRLHTTATAVGIIQDGRPMMRVQCNPGETLFATGHMGIGNAFAVLSLMGHPLPDTRFYRPIARIREGISMRPFASICMDTSDGLFSALDQLGRLNGCGFHLDSAVDSLIAPQALRAASATRLAPWMLLAAPHGEFELVFTVRQDRIDALHRAAREAGWTPVRLGRATDQPGIRIADWATFTPNDLASIRNYPFASAADRIGFPRYLANLAEKSQNSTDQ